MARARKNSGSPLFFDFTVSSISSLILFKAFFKVFFMEIWPIRWCEYEL